MYMYTIETLFQIDLLFYEFDIHYIGINQELLGMGMYYW
jgi:hypothetical protein